MQAKRVCPARRACIKLAISAAPFPFVFHPLALEWAQQKKDCRHLIPIPYPIATLPTTYLSSCGVVDLRLALSEKYPPVSPDSCGHLLLAAVTSACVLLLVIPREVTFVTCCLRRAHPMGMAHQLQSARRVASCCRSRASRTPRLRFWSQMRLTLKAGAVFASCA